MKTIKGLILLLAICLMPAYAADDGKIKEQIVVNIDNAGTLSDKIGVGKKENITSLKITGYINGKDLQMIREMAGGRIDEYEVNGNLETLDLSEAIIVKGETYSYYDAEKHKAAIGYSWDNVIGAHMFYGCKRLRSISLPQTVFVIKDHAFSGCDKLEKIYIGNATKEIGNFAFSECCSLQSVTMPTNVSAIGDSAFSGCRALVQIEIRNTKTPKLGLNVFSGINNSKCRLLVPKGTYKVYWLSAWGDYLSNIIEVNFTEKSYIKRKE